MNREISRRDFLKVAAGMAIPFVAEACSDRSVVTPLLRTLTPIASPGRPTETPTITPTLTPEVTPSPEPPPTPEVIPNIEDVKLVAEGIVTKDLFYLDIYNGTVTSINKNEAGVVESFTITVKGNKITKTCADIANTPDVNCSLKGMTFRVYITERTWLADANKEGYEKIGGPREAADYIESMMGKAVPHLRFGIKPGFGHGTSDLDNVPNKGTLAKVDDNLGEHLTRTVQSNMFPLNALDVYGN